MFGVVSLNHLYRIPPFGLWKEVGGHLGKWHRQQKRGGNFWFLSPVFALWITSYKCLSILANRGLPSICSLRQSLVIICLLVWLDIVFDLSVFIYTTFLFKSQATQEGLEPPTNCLEGRCSIQLSYRVKRPPCLCFYERHGRGGSYVGVGTPLPMRVLYQSLGQVSSQGAHNLISPPSCLHSSV